MNSEFKNIFDYKHMGMLLLLACAASSVALADNSQSEESSYRTVVAVKTNLLSDAFWTPSLSLELPLNNRWTLDLTGEYNNWDGWDDQKWRHWTVQPEIRYWLKESFNHWFVGLHGLGGEYNVGNLKHELPFLSEHLKDLDKYRYQGRFWGAGLGIGYAWQWSKHWGMSAELGFGYLNMKDDQFACEGCQKKTAADLKHDYVGPTKAALNLVYRFTQDKPVPMYEEVQVEIPERPALTPSFVYVRPVSEVVKDRSLEGQAFIEFEVNKTDIQPERANNQVELGKIIASIDSVRNNPDTKISQLSIKGYASPDGPYDKNEVLAKGRTEALSRYVNKLYKFDRGTIKTSHEAEDWEGFRRLVDASTLPHRQQLLDIIDNTSLTRDQREAQIKKLYPDDYDMMRGDILMRLRHSDYVIKYVIRSYTSPEEIREVLLTRPSNLSLAEFYTAAEGYTEGTEEFNQVFLTAVQFYPSDEAANLNAANSYMAEGNLAQARRHLDRAGQSKEAIYARGLYNALTGEYEEALRLLRQANVLGVFEAAKATEQVQRQYDWERTWGEGSGK